MGLDMVEFVMEVEEAFEIRIPDEDALDLTTPRKLVDYIAASLSAKASGLCASQRAFYRLRASLVGRIGCRRNAVQPNSSLFELIAAPKREEIWDGVRQDLGLEKANRWPRLAEKGWFDSFARSRVSTVREAVSAIATHPELAKSREPNLHRERVSATVPVGERYAGWTREQIRVVVHRLVGDNFGINTSVPNLDDMHFQEDMGIP